MPNPFGSFTSATTEKQAPSWINAAIVIGSLASFLWLEIRRPLRRATVSKPPRNVRNAIIGVSAAAAVQLLEVPLSRWTSEIVERRGWGLVRWFRLPRWMETLLALALMDYTLYVWHVLAHRVRFLWRFHCVHHIDVDLDVSTGLRFHFGEIALGAPYRAAQIALIGVSPRILSIWHTWMLVSIAFHHSNIRLEPAIERALVYWTVTPRMHGIHHSTVPEETNSDFSSGLSVWDRLHNTLKLNVPQSAITIGIAGCRSSAGLEDSLMMPFVSQRPEWRMPEAVDSTAGDLNPHTTLLEP